VHDAPAAEQRAEGDHAVGANLDPVRKDLGIHDVEVPQKPGLVGAYSMIALGTLFGGWRIVHTMGTRMTRLRPVGGFCAETGGSMAILLATRFGIPVSTTHTITGAIVGVGATFRRKAVRWDIAGRIVWAWILTIPASAIVAALSYLLLALFIKL
jgi:PiT family inorganic phosphate transporter